MVETRKPKEALSLFTNVAIVGYGATGRLFSTFLDRLSIPTIHIVPQRNLPPDFPESLEVTLKKNPELLILATPNPTEEVLNKIAQLAPQNMTIVLPQNGVEVVDVAEAAFGNAGKNIHFVRASLITPVAQNEKGELIYNTKKKPRIAFAQIEDHDLEVDAVADLFESAGFETRVFDDYRAMEWTKLLVNTIGSTAVITGLTPRDTFRDKEYFEIELRALKDRLMILKAADIELADLPGVPTLLFKLIQKLPVETLLHTMPLRNQIAEFFAKQRYNLPPASRKQLKEGEKSEAIYYHRPFIELGREVDLSSQTDEWLDYLLHNF